MASHLLKFYPCNSQKHFRVLFRALSRCSATHWQFVVEALDFDDKAVLAGHQFVLQLGNFGLVGWLRQVVGQDVHQQVEQHHAVEREGQSAGGGLAIMEAVKTRSGKGRETR